MVKESLYASCLNVVTVGVSLSKIVRPLRCRADVIAITVPVNAVLNVVERGIEALW